MGTALPQGSDENRKVYNRVRVLREERGLSRQELADLLGIGYRTLGYIERENYTPSLALAWKISGFFGVPTDEVFSPEPLRPMSELLFGRSVGDGSTDARTGRGPCYDGADGVASGGT